jgi:hypothetical protein
MYQSLLHAYELQTKNNVNSTPGSPFKYARRILSPFIAVRNASPQKHGYRLGTYRTQLPGNLSVWSFNSILLQAQSEQQLGKNHTGRVIFHQAARFSGYTRTMLLDPQSQTAIVVLMNSLRLVDLPDIAGSLLLGAILGEDDPPSYLGLAKSVISTNISLYDTYTKALSKMKTTLAPLFPPHYYEGDY